MSGAALRTCTGFLSSAHRIYSLRQQNSRCLTRPRQENSCTTSKDSTARTCAMRAVSYMQPLLCSLNIYNFSGVLWMRAHHNTIPLCSGNVLPIWREHWRRPAKTELLTAHHQREISAACRLASWSTNVTLPEVHPGAHFPSGGYRGGHTAHINVIVERASLSLLSGFALESLSLCSRACCWPSKAEQKESATPNGGLR